MCDLECVVVWSELDWVDQWRFCFKDQFFIVFGFGFDFVMRVGDLRLRN